MTTKVQSEQIADASISTDRIADDAVTSAKLDTNISIAGTLASTGVLTANAGVVVDNITIDGTEIDLSSGDLTIDVAGVIKLDADGAEIQIKDGGTEIGAINMASSNLNIDAKVADKDIVFRGIDGSSDITALTLDMSAAGAATFNSTVNGLTLSSAGVTGPDSSNFTLNTANSFRLNIDSNDSGTGESFIVGHNQTLINQSNVLLKVQEDGNVGIGTSSPDTLLNLESAAPILRGTDSDDTDKYGQIEFDNGDIVISADANSGGGYHSGSIITFCVDSGSERARINNSGDFLSNTTTAVASFYNGVSGIGFGYAGGGYGAFVRSGTNTPLYVSTNGQGSGGFIEFAQNGATRGNITYNGSSTLYNASSDYRLKENVTPIQNALSKIDSLNPINFDWKESGDNSDGFLAHEAQTVVSYAVTGLKDEVYTDENSGEEKTNGEAKYQVMDYGKLTPLLVKAIQEQQTIIDDLKTRIATLEG